MKIHFDKIRIDGGTQTRAGINNEVVQEYAEHMADGEKFPPLVVFYDGKDYWLSDGFHRYAASIQNRVFDIEVDVRDGGRREAILFGVAANAKHGLRRTNEDKRRAVTMLFGDEECSQWSDNKLAKLCLVSHWLIGDVRLSLSDSESDNRRTYTNKHGSISKMKTSQIGQHRKLKKQSAGISPNAFQPMRQPDEVVPMLSVSLPLNNPNMGAKALLNRFERDYVIAIYKELTTLLGEEA